MILSLLAAVLWIAMTTIIIFQRKSPSWWITSIMAALLASYNLLEVMEAA